MLDPSTLAGCSRRPISGTSSVVPTRSGPAPPPAPSSFTWAQWSTRADSRNELTRAMSVGRKAQKETRKVDSLDLYPLPPLVRQTSRLSRWENAKPVSTHNRDDEEDEKEEELYSPRGFSGNCDNSNRNGSASKRVFAAVPSGIFDEKV
ncbi:hypothetical protein FF2_009528 [Malus domestica]